MVERDCFKRGHVYYVDLGFNQGSEANGIRPCLVVQNDIGNKYSSTTIVIPISQKNNRNNKDKLLPTHVLLEPWMQKKGKDFKKLNGIVMTEQIRTIDKNRIKFLVGILNLQAMSFIDKAILIAISIVA